MKSSITRYLTTLILLTAGATAFTAAQIPMELAKNWSLFSEYQRNGDYKSALPYGWEVYKLDPKRFKTLYQKLAECYFSFYEKAETPEAKKAYADTVVYVNDLGIEHAPDRASSHWLQKAYALENYFEGARDQEAIAAYEKTLELDYKVTDFAYIDRLGVLYMKHAPQNPEYRTKAIELYQRVLSERPNDAPNAQERLKNLISDPMELIKIVEDRLTRDPENLELLWDAAQANMRGEQYNRAEVHLRKLTQKAPTNATYWNELGKSQQRQRKFKEAIGSYDRALKLNSALKENFLNISVCYREMKNYDQARVYTRRAASSDRGWGRPYIELGEIYKAAVEDCIMGSKGGDWTKLDFDDKLVYKRAQEVYAQAKATEPGITNEANQLSNGLNSLVPTKEDFFFNKDRIKDGKITIEGACYSWIKESITVPR